MQISDTMLSNLMESHFKFDAKGIENWREHYSNVFEFERSNAKQLVSHCWLP